MTGLAAWDCPHPGCDSDRAEWLGGVQTPEGIHIGDMLRCLKCGKPFEEVKWDYLLEDVA